MRAEFVTYAYILLYIALSSGQIFFNKWVLSSKEINFPYPLGLTLLHMIFSSVLCFLLTKVLKVILQLMFFLFLFTSKDCLTFGPFSVLYLFLHEDCEGRGRNDTRNVRKKETS
jgi:hypothetical protein